MMSWATRETIRELSGAKIQLCNRFVMGVQVVRIKLPNGVQREGYLIEGLIEKLICAIGVNVDTVALQPAITNLKNKIQQQLKSVTPEQRAQAVAISRQNRGNRKHRANLKKQRSNFRPKTSRPEPTSHFSKSQDLERKFIEIATALLNSGTQSEKLISTIHELSDLKNQFSIP